MKNEIDLLSQSIIGLCGTFNFDRKIVLEALLASYETIGNESVNRLGLPAIMPDYDHDGLKIELNRRFVSMDGVYVPITGKEWALLELLVKSDGRPVPKTEMSAAIYAKDSPESNTLEVFLSHLRSKLGKDAILTMRGVGYLLSGKRVLKQ